MKTRHFLVPLVASTFFSVATAQTEIYPQHFNLSDVTLLDSPFKTAMQINDKLLLDYDADRLLAPFIRQAGLDKVADSQYYNWTETHPSFRNWGESNWSLEGHVGGHYLTALALAYAAADDATVKAAMKERLDYCIGVLDDCQKAFDSDATGLKGFIGGQPINQIWTGLYSGSTTEFRKYGGWVPLYCEHKVFAGLRDAWLYTGSTKAKEMYRKICDWSVDLIAKLTDTQLQDILGWEHGGMNETLADAYRIFGDARYLDASKRYSHQMMVTGMETLNTTFLDGKHANTQVPKYIGFERMYQEALRAGNAADYEVYRTAAHNFWQDVAENRTVCIGGNSVGEHFLSAENSGRYISNTEGPESCNSNNMLKLSEDLFDETHDARYADFYESTMWNHILSTQDPDTGGYVYFTSLRPQSYRIYSQVNQGMWCCVGTGMENHQKYGHFIYTHSDDNTTLYVNLFTASKLSTDRFAVTQETEFPYAQTSKITVDKAGTFTMAIRHPHWTTDGYTIKVNGTAVTTDTQVGTASYVNINRTWKAGDVVEVTLPMTLRYEECPHLSDYIAFKYGPILLAAKTTASSADEAVETGLTYEELQNEYGGEGRMDHSPASMGKALSVSTSPLLIGDRADVLKLISETNTPLTFTINAASTQSKGNWSTLKLVPFYTIHHARYNCYWYQATPEVYAASDMGRTDAQEAAIASRTIDYVATGEQQSEAGHQASYSIDSTSGMYEDEYYRDAQKGGYVQYTLENKSLTTEGVSLMVRYTTADKGRVATIYVNGTKLTEAKVLSTTADADDKGFYNVEYPIPASLLVDDKGNAKTEVTVRFEASGNTVLPGLYYVRLLSGYEEHLYTFVASDWTTGDSGRVTAENISYDTENNTITVNAGTGSNNICLTLDYVGKQYNVKADQKYLVVKGTNLSKSTGASYLWWLNGINKASSVAPTQVTELGDELVVAWDLSKTGLDANCKDDIWSVCQGQTIFGLTSTTGTSTISDINFVSSVDSYLGSLNSVCADAAHSATVYNVQGMKLRSGVATDNALNDLPSGVYIVNGKKVVK